MPQNYSMAQALRTIPNGLRSYEIKELDELLFSKSNYIQKFMYCVKLLESLTNEQLEGIKRKLNEEIQRREN